MDRLLDCNAGGRHGFSEMPPTDWRSPAINESIGTQMMEHTPSKPRLILPRVAERRKTTYLNGPPFIDDDGLVLVDRRSNEERRGKLRNRTDNTHQVCALLRFPAKDDGNKK